MSLNNHKNTKTLQVNNKRNSLFMSSKYLETSLSPDKLSNKSSTWLFYL